MNQTIDINATCSRCGHEHKVPTYPSISISDNPELKEKVKDGSLFVWECPDCGQMNLVKYQSLYHDPEKKLMVWLIPENAVSREELSVIEQHMEAIGKSIEADPHVLEDYCLRRVSDTGSLMEKIIISDAGLDDVVIELCKYVTKLELAEKLPAAEQAKIMDAGFKFYRMDGADNDITLTYPMDGAMQGVKIGFNVYEDCLGILKRNPAARPAAGFVKVDAEWLATRIR